jgi:predicted transcriptional regulator
MSQGNVEIERRLREAGAVFIEAHDRAVLAIREASHAGMTAEAIAHTSGLSPATVRIFLRAGAE